MKAVCKKILSIFVLLTFWIHFCSFYTLCCTIESLKELIKPIGNVAAKHIEHEPGLECLSLVKNSPHALKLDNSDSLYEAAPQCCKSKFPEQGAPSLPKLVTGCACAHPGYQNAMSERLDQPTYFSLQFQAASFFEYETVPALAPSFEFTPTIFHPPQAML